MFANLLHLFAAAVLNTGLAPNPSADLPAATASADMLPSVTATLYITYAGSGYWMVTVSGHATAANANVGVRVYGDDPWFDDFLFSMGIPGYTRTDGVGNFAVSQMVWHGTLNEDWDGTDEIYAIADVSGAGSVRTNTISRSF